jgi:putative ABC transport system permease protein
MNELFGLQLSSIMVALVVVLGIALVSVLWIALRRPVIFKLGVRNIPRRKAQTALTVVGLMLSTMIIAAAFGTGDTLDYSLTSSAYTDLGHVDELVVASRDIEAKNVDPNATIPAGTLATVQQALDGNNDVDGVMPVLDVRAPVLNQAAGQREPEVVLTGLDPSLVGQFGGLQATNGDTIDLATLPANTVVVSELLADELELAASDTIEIYYNNVPVQYTVAAVAEDSYLSGVRPSVSSDDNAPGLAMPLAGLQQLTGSDQLTAIAISNTGSVRDSLAPTDDVVDTLSAALGGQNLGIDPIKQDRVDQATSRSNLFTGLFLVFGLFSIAAGVLLIVLIFSMLAAERRSEMGMERAIGAQRRQLIQQFISEGTMYALLAGLVGVTLGVAASALVARIIKPMVGEGTTITWHVTSTSTIVSYCLGVAITFLSVVLSSWRISRLNVVSAIRDIADVTTLARNRRSIVWGIVLLVIGAAATGIGVAAEVVFPFRLGLSLLPFGVALVLRYFGVPSRAVFTAVGLYLLFIWLLPVKQFEQIFGKHGEGDFELFFLSGIFLVFATSILVVQNGDLLLRGVSLIGGVLKGRVASFRTAVSYPSATPVRTGMTIAMFCLIVFALVMVATMSRNFANYFLSDKADAGWTVRVDTNASNPVDDLSGALAAQGIDTSEFSAVGSLSSPSLARVDVRLNGADEWEQYQVEGMDASFIDNSDLSFRNHAAGYDSDEAILEALRTEPNVAVADANILGGGGGPQAAPVDQFSIDGIDSDTQGFAPIVVDLAVPGSDEVRQVKIIGILDPQISTIPGILANASTVSAIYPAMAETSYYVALNDSADAHEVATSIEAGLSANGVQAKVIADEIADARTQSESFFYIVQGFMGLGLIVGIAAIGVIAFRSVVERRQQIGVLRAIGYQRGEVALSFLIETVYIVAIGVISGTALGLILARNLFKGDELGTEGATFTVPWAMVSLVLAATVIVALLMTWMPARQASRIAPAEALRYE